MMNYSVVVNEQGLPVMLLAEDRATGFLATGLTVGELREAVEAYNGR